MGFSVTPPYIQQVVSRVKVLLGKGAITKPSSSVKDVKIRSSENGISLGFFPDEKSARKVQRARVEDGYAVKIKSVERSAEELWAVLQVNEYNKLEANQWQKLQRELGKWQQRQNYCKLIASVKELE